MSEKTVVLYDAHKELGVPEDKAKEIRAAFKPMLEKGVELEEEFNEVMKLGDSKEASEAAGELRRKYVKVRTGTDQIHKSAKKYYLVMGRAVDGMKNALLAQIAGNEERLKSKEDHFINLEKERIASIAAQRMEELSPYGIDFETVDVSTMSDAVYENFKTGTIANYKLRKEAEEKAEAERIEQQRKLKLYGERKEQLFKFGKFANIEALSTETSEEDFQDHLTKSESEFVAYEAEQEKIRLENEKLRADAEAKEAKRLKEEEERNKAAAATAAAAAKKIAAAQAKAAAAVAEAKKLKEAAATKEAEQAAAAAAAEAAAAEEARNAELASDKEKLQSFVNSISWNDLDTSKMDKESKKVHTDIIAKGENFKKWAIDQISKIK